MGRRVGSLAALAAVGWLVWCGVADAGPSYKCGAHTYSDRPCTGGREVGAAKPHRLDHHATPPQDRAKLARRAELKPEVRERCEALDTQLVEQQAALDKLPQPVQPSDERELVQSKLKYHQLRC
ncbi:hypothetical protein HHL11_14630 [Ramlibacter sp. G-1-2-2]|uniref:Uncharacterized protein n=1 Tax=Ramlibacter agri TaxID=2728837 RepID=A0A848H641_9BURK|nr:hypothetical protein [Ramlibacter agri]NML44991.1 hypothetical protein [Ramlibacter agri]